MLERVKIVRELFVMDIETGGAVMIPELLSQKEFPASFRYYDPIIAFIQEGISDHIRIKAQHRVSSALEYYDKNYDGPNGMLNFLYKVDKEALSVKTNALNKLGMVEVNHH